MKESDIKYLEKRITFLQNTINILIIISIIHGIELIMLQTPHLGEVISSLLKQLQ